MKQGVFTIDGNQTAYIGYTAGASWNGWATPYFEKDEAIRMMRDFNAHHQGTMTYNEATDTFRVYDTMCGDYEEWEGFNGETEHGIKHLYGIGAYCWIWDELTDEDALHLAQEIDEFLYEYDELFYEGELDGSANVVAKIHTQLENRRTFVVAYTLMNDDTVEADEKFAKIWEAFVL
jgi:arginyl-tRNA synthetase